MSPPRYTVRLPAPLDALVQEHLRTSGTPFAVLIRDALSAYLAATPPPAMLTPADRADTLKELQEHVADLTMRVKVLEEILTRWPPLATSHADSGPPLADREADRAQTAADTSRAQPRGQRKLTPRQVRALRDKRQCGVSIPALMDEYGISRATVFRYLQSEKR